MDYFMDKNTYPTLNHVHTSKLVTFTNTILKIVYLTTSMFICCFGS